LKEERADNIPKNQKENEEKWASEVATKLEQASIVGHRREV